MISDTNKKEPSHNNLIVHIATDEKFINSAHLQFERVGGIENKFYILVDDIQKDLQHVKIETGMQLVQNSVLKLKELGRSLTDCNLVCFHGLDYYSSIVLNNVPSNQKVLWMLFGMEVYNNPHLFSKKEITGNKTFEKFITKSILDTIQSKIKDIFRNSIYKIKRNTSSPFNEVTTAMKRANYCGILYKEEFKLVQRKLAADIQYFKFTYYPIEKMLADPDVFVSGGNILLGNSASYTNNHLEAFNILSQFNLTNRKVITPLSYGDNEYKQTVEKEGAAKLKTNFFPLVDFMPLHEYNTFIQSCSIVVMNHYRQQAVGNVLVMLWMGAKVYLDKRNTLYPYLNRIGVVVYEISKDLHSDNPKALDPLTREKQLKNRNILKNEISEEFLFTQLQQSLSNIL